MDHTGGAEKAFYCWGWRVTSIGCPDCEHECLRVSIDWAQLSLLGDGGSTAHPRRRRTEIQSRPGTNLEGDPRVRHGHPRTLTCSWVHQTWLQEYFPQTLGALRLGEGLAPVFGVFLWHLALSPLIPSLSHPPHLSKMADVKRLIRAQRSQGSGLSV